MAKLFEDKKAAIASGKFEPFQGPIKDQSGATVVAAGATVPLKDLLSMNFDAGASDGTTAERSVGDLDLRSVVCVPLVRMRTGAPSDAASIAVAAPRNA